MRPDGAPVRLEVDMAVGAQLAREVGPAAWVVLEGLAARTTSTGRGHEARTSVRDLAVGLGVSKDTVARAVNKLIRVDVVERSGFGQDEAGRFVARTYRVHLQRAGLRVLEVAHPEHEAVEARRLRDIRHLLAGPPSSVPVGGEGTGRPHVAVRPSAGASLVGDGQASLFGDA